MNLCAYAQQSVEGEIVLGPTITSVGSGPDLKSYLGVGFGVGVNAHLVSFDGGSLGISIPPLFVFWNNPTSDGLDYQRLHLPIGLMLRIGDNTQQIQSGEVAGAITVGYGATFGVFTGKQIDARPFFNIDIIVGIFERGAFKLRYSNVFGRYLFDNTKLIAYHGLFIVGSTEW